jgi:hypothetical protein
LKFRLFFASTYYKLGASSLQMNVVGYKYVYRVKKKGNGSLEPFKAWLLTMVRY